MKMLGLQREMYFCPLESPEYPACPPYFQYTADTPNWSNSLTNSDTPHNKIVLIPSYPAIPDTARER